MCEQRTDCVARIRPEALHARLAPRAHGCARELPLAARRVLYVRAVRRRDEITEAKADNASQAWHAQPHMDLPPDATRDDERQHVEEEKTEGGQSGEEAQL